MPGSAATIAASDIDADHAIASLGRLMLVAGIGMLLVVMTVVAAVFYARESIDTHAIDAERQRAARALSVADPGIPDALQIGHDYLLRDARIAPSAQIRKDEAAISIPGVSGLVFAWTPERPGTDLFYTIAPLRLAVSGIFLAGVFAILWQMFRIARRLEVARASEAQRALRDPLTGLGNRAAFEQRLVAGFSNEQPIALLYIDLDDFKTINDRLGHPAGDAVLQAVARRFGALARDGAEVYRIGGDEFAILVVGAAPTAELVAIANRAADELATPVDTGRGDAVVGLSIGIARREPGKTAGELVAAADAALYRAKASGEVLSIARTMRQAA